MKNNVLKQLNKIKLPDIKIIYFPYLVNNDPRFTSFLNESFPDNLESLALGDDQRKYISIKIKQYKHPLLACLARVTKEIWLRKFTIDYDDLSMIIKACYK